MMHPNRAWIPGALAALIVIQGISAGQVPVETGQTLDENLKLLEPLAGKRWVGQIKALDRDEYLEIVRRFDIVWNGSAVKITGYCKALDSEREGFIFWDSIAGRIAMFAINNRGIVQQGHIEERDGKIVVAGSITFPDRRLEFENTFELTPAGGLIDEWFRLEDGEWLPGHRVELTAEE